MFLLHLLNVTQTQRSLTMTPDFLPENAVPFTNAYAVNVTPELAKTWLECCDVSRPFSERQIKHFADQMKAGRWQQTYQGIAFNKNRFLIDGRHRLFAVIESGQTVPMLVVTDVDIE
jgi:hypothetical protein